MKKIVAIFCMFSVSLTAFGGVSSVSCSGDSAQGEKYSVSLSNLSASTDQITLNAVIMSDGGLVYSGAMQMYQQAAGIDPQSKQKYEANSFWAPSGDAARIMIREGELLTATLLKPEQVQLSCIAN